MKVLSTNTATALKIDIKGKKVSTGFYKKPTGNGIFLNQMGVDNDYVADLKHHGGIDKACYLYGAQNYHFWKSLYPNLVFEYGMLGENITITTLGLS